MIKIIILSIRAYQYIARPFLVPCCRFLPSCSEYAISAMQKYGFFKGTRLSLKRICKCHPLSRGGWDPLL